MPYLADTKLAVSFTNIRINTDYQLIEGVVSTTYDTTWGDVESVDEEVEDMEDLIDDIFGEDTTEESNVDTDVINDTTTGESTNTNTNDTDNSNTDTSNNSSSDSSTTNTTDTTNSNSGTNTTTDTNAIENGSTDTNNTTSSTIEKEVVIEHNGKSYKNKDIIEVPYSREETNFAFLLKNYPKGAKINWQVLKLGTDNTSIFATNETIHDNFGINMKEIHILDVVANYNDEKIRVTIKRIAKEFELEELVVQDGRVGRKRRAASSDETLYFVDNKLGEDLRSVRYGIKINPKLDEEEIIKNSISWTINEEENIEDRGKKRIYEWIPDSNENTKTIVKAGYSKKIEKEVNVKWIDEDLMRIDIAHKLGPIFKAFDKLNYVTKKLSPALPCDVQILDNYKTLLVQKKLGISYQTKNEEIKYNRLYKEVQKFKFSANNGVDIFKLNCGKEIKVYIPGTSYEITLAGAKFSISSGLKGEIMIQRDKEVETNRVSYANSNVSGGGFIKPSLKATLVGVDGTVELSAGIRFVYPYKKNPDIVGIEAYLSDTYGYLLISKDVSLFVTNDFKYELFKLETSGKIEITTFDIGDLIN
ncbi:hypothetical protein [Tenacibaculum maritimum]|uniref:hypothetical protein n=1 Tax=Tenacibaculum maritimum TaxID=107401 RepID=UPI00387626A5